MNPEWLRMSEAVKFSGIGRSTLYSAIASGRIKSACVRKRGCVKGIRLISVAALRSFIESQVEEREIEGPPSRGVIKRKEVSE